MKLYHYASEKFTTLKTTERQGVVTKQEREEALKQDIELYKKTKIRRPGYYFEHISFFFERPPIEEMSSFFTHKHEFWYKGHQIYEHIIDTADVLSFKYSIVEFPEKTALLYDDSVSDKDYYKLLKEKIDQCGYIGTGNTELERAYQFNHLEGTTKHYYQLLKKRPNYEDIKNKYAATVPHVMLFPITGTIQPESISLVTVK